MKDTMVWTTKGAPIWHRWLQIVTGKCRKAVGGQFYPNVPELQVIPKVGKGSFLCWIVSGKGQLGRRTGDLSHGLHPWRQGPRSRSVPLSRVLCHFFPLVLQTIGTLPLGPILAELFCGGVCRHGRYRQCSTTAARDDMGNTDSLVFSPSIVCFVDSPQNHRRRGSTF